MLSKWVISGKSATVDVRRCSRIGDALGIIRSDSTAINALACASVLANLRASSMKPMPSR
jgi:hypothetical protein